MAHKLIGAVVGAIALVLTVPMAAMAVPAQLTVTNLAQPGFESDVPQPPVTVAARWNCGTPFSAQEANTGISTCAPGSWPATTGGGDAWGPEVRVAGGDRLQLVFDAAAEQVRFSSTTNYPRGMRDPSGAPYPNFDIVAARDADPTGDPSVWTLELPPDLDRAQGPGGTFSVVARAAGVWRNFALMIRAPRWKNDVTKCGAIHSPTWYDPGCLMPPGPPPGFGADRRPPSLKVRVARRQRVRRLRPAVAYARCDELCTVKVTGRLKVGRRSYELLTASKPAAAGKLMLLRVRLTPVATRALGRALRSRRRATVALAARARDVKGNRSPTVRRTVTVR